MGVESRARKVEEVDSDLEQLPKATSDAARILADRRPELALQAHQAEWHVRGIQYHCQNFYSHYRSFIGEASKRLQSGADVIIMYSPESQRMMFEFYALVILARITFDNLRFYIHTVFATPFPQLPKSITDFFEGQTNCPIYEQCRSDPRIQYLIDIRNCLVHHRSFATSDNAILVKEGTSPSDVLAHSSISSMTRGSFRLVGENGVAVNVFLPDKIYDRSGSDTKLARFTYEARWHILSMSFAFATVASEVVASTLLLVASTDGQPFRYEKKRRGKAGGA
jgi:hypothetical protein